MSAPLEMNPEIRARWTAALRSGEYQQGLEALRQVDEDGDYEFCCLGVLCELGAAAGITEAAYNEDEGTWAYGAESAYLPPPVAEWAELPLVEDYPELGRRWSLPRVMTPQGEETLVALNDELRWDFARIADAIDGTDPAEVTR